MPLSDNRITVTIAMLEAVFHFALSIRSTLSQVRHRETSDAREFHFENRLSAHMVGTSSLFCGIRTHA